MLDIAWGFGSSAILWWYAVDCLQRGLKKPDARAIVYVMLLESSWLAVINLLDTVLG